MNKTLITISCFFFVFVTWSQGCSDAGICSINKGFYNDSIQKNNSFEFSTNYSLGEADVEYLSYYISYTKRFNKRIAFTSKVTLSTANGSFGSLTQLGDAFLIGNYSLQEKKNKHWSTLLGVKLPFTNSNSKINENSLPLDYQSSLGTIDMFLGTNLKYKNWDFNSAIQIPIVNLNKNSFVRENSGNDNFPTTNLFERKSDLLVRATYSKKVLEDRLTFKPNVLFIFHLREDSYEDFNGQRKNINGSNGLTVNGNLITNYYVNTKSQIELSIASPFLVRKIRPDGLTRSFVLGLNYQYSF